MNINPRRIFHRQAGSLLIAIALAQHRPVHAQAPSLELDVPFVVTPDNVVLRMLDMAQVTARDTLIDLGSGDGRIVITAALRFGAQASGVEIDPALVEKARELALRAGVASRTSFRTQDLFETDLSQASVITMYLLPDVNLALRPKLLALRPGVRLVSHDWDMGDWPPDQQATVDAPEKSLGLKKVARIMMWTVPAQVSGRHRGNGVELLIKQRYQQIESVRLALNDQSFELDAAAVSGPSVALSGVDALGKPLRLTATVASPAAEISTIEWRLRRGDAPELKLVTRRD